MLVIVIVLFTVCWGPTLIDNVLAAFGLIDKLNYDNLKYLRQAFALMSYFNSCVNPVVYAFMSKHWRESFKYALCLCSSQNDRHRKYYHQYSHQMSPVVNPGGALRRSVNNKMASQVQRQRAELNDYNSGYLLNGYSNSKDERYNNTDGYYTSGQPDLYTNL